MEFNLTNLDVIFYIVFMLAFTVFAAIKGYKSTRLTITSKNTPILLAYYTKGAALFPIGRGKIGGFDFTSFITMAAENRPIDSLVGAVFFIVELPFATSTHLVGIPKGNNTIQINPAYGDSHMEEVVLEGDYPNYFSVYADKNMQLKTRYLLDPSAMAFTVDFCQSHNWEIVDTELIFTKHVLSTSEDDPTAMSDDIANFIEAIRPAIEVPLTELQIKLREPYNKKKKVIKEEPKDAYNRDFRESLPCPVCNKAMPNQKNHFACPDSDGILISGRHLLDLKQGKLGISITDTSRKRNQEDLITCPSCDSGMWQVPYSENTTIIDSCSKCHYRWIEDGELSI